MSQHSPEADDGLYPIAVLIDELKHDDVVLRLNAIKRLSVIATALGPEQTRSKLIPFLDESVEDEDEVLTALAKELGEFSEYVGGADYAHLLLKPLESLAAIEEPAVRDQAVESITSICKLISAENVEDYIIPVISNLTTGDWFTTKVSAAGLYAAAYPRVSKSTQTQLRASFQGLVEYESPMVRRAAARHLPDLLARMDSSNADQAITMFNSLASDEQDSVRLLVVDILVAMAYHMHSPSSNAVVSQLEKSLPALIKDKGWRVRCMVAERFEQIARAVDRLGSKELRQHLVPGFNSLLGDGEAEVRTAVAGQIPGFCQFVKDSDMTAQLNDIRVRIEDRLTDSSSHVRAAIALHLSALAPIFGKEEATRTLLPMFTHSLQDEVPEVRLNFISKLKIVTDVIGIELFSSSLLPAIQELAEDTQWRVRLAIIEYMPSLASQLGIDAFSDKLGKACFGWLTDSVESIRKAATRNLRKLTEVYGISWASSHLVPQIHQMGLHDNSMYRLTACYAYSELGPVVTIPIIKQFLIPTQDMIDNHGDSTLQGLAADDIPNIKFNAAKAYGSLIDVLQKLPDERTSIYSAEQSGTTHRLVGGPVAEELISKVIVPVLEKLEKDEDVDVRYFASQALTKVRGSDAMEQ